MHPDAGARRGLGSAPGCARSAAGDGHAEAVLWVVAGNARARRFYERYGWVPAGVERAEEVAVGVLVTEARYRTALAPGR